MAGTIAASFENLTGSPALAEGVVGVAPQARILAYKVCAADGTCTDAAVIQAITRAVADGAKVINMSLGDTVYSQSLADAVQAAWNAGVVIVAGAGNDGATTPFYPAALDNVMAVGAFDEDHLPRLVLELRQLGGHLRAGQQHPLHVSGEQVRGSGDAGRYRLLCVVERHVDGHPARGRRRGAAVVARRRDEQRAGRRSPAAHGRPVGRVEHAARHAGRFTAASTCTTP